MPWDRNYRVDLAFCEEADVRKALRAIKRTATRWGCRVSVARLGVYPAPDCMHAQIEQLKANVCRPFGAGERGRV